MQKVNEKSNYQFLSYGGSVCQLRSLAYAMMCGKNDFNVQDQEFIAGCNRFGLDNPVPIITRRLSTYGNEENIEKMIDRLAKQYNNPNFLDAEKFTSIVPDKSAKTILEIGTVMPPNKQDTK